MLNLNGGQECTERARCSPPERSSNEDRRKLTSVDGKPQTKGVPNVHSAHHRSVTVVTVVTLIFTPMLKHHHWFNFLTGKTVETTIVQCGDSKPCPKKKVEIRKIILPPQP